MTGESASEWDEKSFPNRAHPWLIPHRQHHPEPRLAAFHPFAKPAAPLTGGCPSFIERTPVQQR